MALGSAAESYLKVVYLDHDFPHTSDSAVCVLRLQTIGADAADRLARFHQLVVVSLDQSLSEIA
ncbi:hypothetical protein [Tessaracoccus sp. OH4464_COT-324]|uniref:hypothetical protein n=1 Tax=Tessaracoccus sp. OH4464_COT-324 TaxID=2491059 RepID=UPI000F635CA4|nr:hypothetical protein [Tessaracoccus sp. OH4464_COT-324]RRD46502.1 hypothetical protein EII42_06825 [Tessaracoccus sp. OH4464_COT-324]